jgi:asparagine synthase (glutamine-hydrolysing)
VCGIFGFWARGGNRPGLDGRLLRECTATLTHRGPDGVGGVGWTAAGEPLTGQLLDERPLAVGLGHRRLAIVDLSDAGLQPMRGADGSWLCFNGELYNYREVRAELERAGVRFHTATDTEVVLAAYSTWGMGCVERFNGMWAFLLFDPTRRRLFACRDRMGVKPLYFAASAQGVAFASEIPALLRCPGVSTAIRADRLADYFLERRTDDAEQTMYRDISELRGGELLELDLDRGALERRTWWRLPEAPDLELTDEQALDQFSALIEDAVRLRLHADVPVAITLSGGVDSSVVTVAASRLAPGGVRTFTSRFPGLGIDESSYAAEVAAACRADAHFVEPSTANVVAEEPMLTRHQALPYASLSLYVHWAILACIRGQGVPAVISGQGGDETFLGYDRFHGTAAYGALPDAREAARVVWQGSRNSGLALPGMLATMAFFQAPGVARVRRRARLARYLRPEWLRPSGPPIRHVLRNRRRQQELELRVLSLPALLRYDDRTAGALGMETRLPFLDYRLVEFSYRLPMRHKIRDGWTKYTLRRYLERHGLPAIAWRKRKVGFEAPQAEWTRSLVAARGTALAGSEAGRALLRPGRGLDAGDPKVAWDLYLALHLAVLLGWDLGRQVSGGREASPLLEETG